MGFEQSALAGIGLCMYNTVKIAVQYCPDSLIGCVIGSDHSQL